VRHICSARGSRAGINVRFIRCGEISAASIREALNKRGCNDPQIRHRLGAGLGAVRARSPKTRKLIERAKAATWIGCLVQRSRLQFLLETDGHSRFPRNAPHIREPLWHQASRPEPLAHECPSGFSLISSKASNRIMKRQRSMRRAVFENSFDNIRSLPNTG